MGMKDKLPSQIFCAMALASLCVSAYAGRPLGVDDANVDDSGTGHVEAWASRDANGANAFNLAPAYAPLKNIELDALFSRNTTNRVNTATLQIKALFTEPQKQGCNFGGSLGVARTEGSGLTQSFSTPYVNGIMSCNQGDFAFHTNLGANRPDGARTLASWGLALEETVGKDFSGHIEIFGQQESKSTVQFGLKKQLDKLQIDGTVGRTDGKSLYTLGVKFTF